MNKKLKVIEAMVSPTNFNKLLEENSVSKEIDLLSIDVDGNDYYIFDALKVVSPRVIIVEYNAKMHPPLKWVMKYNPEHYWNGSDYYGASLESFVQLFALKGYSIVCCNITGCNAFFVRNDLLNDKFCKPYSAENHYEPARFFLINGMISGHPTQIGEFEVSYHDGFTEIENSLA